MLLLLSKMIKIQVIAQPLCLILAQATHTKKIQLSILRENYEEHMKRL